MSEPFDIEANIVKAIEGLHENFRAWDRRFWQHFVDGSTPDVVTIIGEIPPIVVNHPLFEECLPGDEAARLDVETGSYEAVRKITPSDCVVDVGAHVGHFTRKALERGALVTAVEPDPRNFRMLSRLLMEWPVELTLCPVAAGYGQPELVTLHRSRFSTQHHLGKKKLWLDEWAPPPVRVPMMQPADLILDATFIKIDVEESELAVLNGLAGTIAKLRPFIVAEVTADMDGCAAFLHHRDYSIQASTHMHLPPTVMVEPIPGLWHCTPMEDTK